MENSSTQNTELVSELSISPVGNILGDLPGLVADSATAMLGMFYPIAVGKKANVALSELVTNVMENIFDAQGIVRVRIEVSAVRLRISVTNTAAAQSYQAVSARITELQNSPNPKKLFADTIRARRSQQLKGGIGLMRLVAENKFKLSVDYDDALLTVHAEYRLEATS